MTRWYILTYEHSVSGKRKFETESLFDFGKKLEEIMFDSLVMESTIDFYTEQR